VTDEKTPVEKAVELVVYAPIGFVNFLRTMLPGWIEGGRTEVNKQVATAKAVSELAIAQGRKDAEKAVHQASEVVSNIAARRQGSPGAAAATPGPPNAAPSSASTPSSASSPSSNGPRPSAEGLAIPGYDSLAASQVVQRLGGLSGAELDAVRGYEESTRGRRTILNRIAQLQTETDS
jgi:hypothetical protein